MTDSPYEVLTTPSLRDKIQAALIGVEVNQAVLDSILYENTSDLVCVSLIWDPATRENTTMGFFSGSCTATFYAPHDQQSRTAFGVYLFYEENGDKLLIERALFESTMYLDEDNDVLIVPIDIFYFKP